MAENFKDQGGAVMSRDPQKKGWSFRIENGVIHVRG